MIDLPPQEQARLAQVTLLTLAMSASSTLISCGVGLPVGAWLGLRKGRFTFAFRVFTQTFYGMPPVLAGLLVFFLLSRAGPLGAAGILFTPEAMVIAQLVILIPLVVGLTASAVGSVSPEVVETARSLGASPRQLRWTVIAEARVGILTAMMLAFARAISEIGAVLIVGGNIKWKTQVLTTSIYLETDTGNFSYALALGAILLVIAAVIAFFVTIAQWEEGALLRKFAFPRPASHKRRGKR